jgi:uncharacterized membrane protein
MDIALFSAEGLVMFLRFVHFFAGVTWIGLLYYFNFIQGAFFNEIEAPVKNVAFSKLVPKALWWFRYGALFTFLSGLGMLAIQGAELKQYFFSTPYGLYIWPGALMGTIMFLNVWLVIWPNQKVLIANAENVLKGGAANPDAAKHAGKALLASRTNTLFSIPLLFFMGASRHLGLGMGMDVSPYPAVAVITAIILAIEVNAIKGKLGPLTTVKGVIHCGLGLLVVLYGLLEVMV